MHCCGIMVTLLFKYLHFKIQVGVQSYMTYIRNSEKTRSVKKGDLKEANHYISGLSKSGFSPREEEKEMRVNKGRGHGQENCIQRGYAIVNISIFRING